MSNLPKTNILRLTIEIAVFVTVVVADAYGFVPITQTLFLVPLIWIMLRLSGERWSEIGLARPNGVIRRLRDNAFDKFVFRCRA